MYWHFCAYSESLGSVTDSDVNAADDLVLQSRNSHLLMAEPFNLLAAYGSSTTLTRARFGNIALTTRGNSHLWPLGRTATPPSRPRPMDLRMMPMALPMNEEITILASTDALGPAVANFGLWLGKPQWTRNLPQGLQTLTTRATVVIPAGAASTWGNTVAIVMERDLYNGVYAVVGAMVVSSTAQFFRMYFTSQPQTQGRQLRPGGLVTNALGDFHWEAQSKGFGEWGRFHTFELPSIQCFGDATGGTYEVRLELVYLGEDRNLLFSPR